MFGFADNQKRATYGHGYILTKTKKKDEAFIDKVEGIAHARFRIDHIHWYVLHCTPSIKQQSVLSKQILGRTPTELRYFERSVLMKEVHNQSLWNFELGSRESMKVPI